MKSPIRLIALLALLLAGGCATPVAPRKRMSPPAQTFANGLTRLTVPPSDTDAAIQTFDSPHFCYVNRAIIVAHAPNLPADRRQLLLWLTGTNGKGGGAAQFCATAADLGYHVISLMYPDDIPASVCAMSSDPAAFENFRLAIIAGGSTPRLTIDRADSIENRLVKLLLWLAQNRPRENWAQFLNADGSIKWESIAVAGQSQGGGHAALIAIKHRVARVICTGAPKDYSKILHRPAAWYDEASATPKACFFSFFHQQDHQGCSPAEQLDNLHALSLDAFGAPADVDDESPPFYHTRILTTNYPGGKLDSKTAHTSVIANKNATVFGQVWHYMLTEPVP